MIILLKSKLFTDPDARFSKEYNIPRGIWNEMFRRYKLNDYPLKDISDLLLAKSGIRVNEKTLNRWIVRSEIYTIARPHIEQGQRAVQSAIFHRFEDDLVSEITKNLRFSVKKKINILA